MTIATGLKKIALIQAGKRNNLNVFEPTKKFVSKLTDESDEETNVFIYNNGDLNSLGFITCAEVSRIKYDPRVKPDQPQTSGRLFIGGSYGVSVLCKNDGSGWNTKDGLSQLSSNDFPGNGFSFLNLNPPKNFSFLNIRKLVSDGKYLYILTKTDLYRLEMNQADFRKNTVINNDRIKHLAGVDNLFINNSEDNIKMNKYVDEFFDLIVIDNTNDNKKLAIGTTKGIWVSSSINDIFDPNKLTWNRNINNDGSELKIGPALQFNFKSTSRGNLFNQNNKLDGNLYLTAIDSEYNFLNVYRFDVNDGNPVMIKEIYTDSEVSTPYFYQLSDLSEFEKNPKFNGELDHIASEYEISETISELPSPDKFLPNEENKYSAIKLNLDPQTALHMLVQIQDTASGAIYIPGNFSVFVNE